MPVIRDEAPRAPKSLDHLALWTADRDRLARLLCDHLGMHVIERTDAFTLVGVAAKLGKLTLFAADGPREPGALEHVALRVADVDRAVAALPDDVAVERPGDGTAVIAAPEGIRIALVPSRDGQTDYDLDHIVLRAPDPDASSQRLTQLGFEREGDRLVVGGDRHLRLAAGAVPETDRPLLNHIALLVDSAEEHAEAAKRVEAEIDEMKDAPNTYAAFVWGPDRLRIEYVEHKPTFSLV